MSRAKTQEEFENEVEELAGMNIVSLIHTLIHIQN